MTTETHCAQVLDYLKSGGRLTVYKSEEIWGHRRLPARVCELRKLGHPIQKQMVQVTNRFGEKCHVAEYYWEAA